MNEVTIKTITAELRDNLVGLKFGKIFVLDRARFVIDFRGEQGRYLLVSASPAEPRLYLVSRKLKDLNNTSRNPTNFASLLRKLLTHSVVSDITKIDNERIVQIELESRDDAGLDIRYFLVVQLTGRSSNMFVLDAGQTIVASLKETQGEGQEQNQHYAPPPSSERQNTTAQESFSKGKFELFSDALDEYYRERDAARKFKNRSDSARALIRNDLKKKRRLSKKLAADLKNHGAPEKWKRLGDLVNANIATAVREGDVVTAVDYFDKDLPTIEIEIDRNISLSEAAEKYFKRYTKSRNAQVEVKRRIDEVDRKIEKLEARLEGLERTIEKGIGEKLDEYLPRVEDKKKSSKSAKASSISKYARNYISSDGYTLLVGKRSKDNDYLTFRIARSLDIWLHAADYPGSHVVIKRKGREEVPQTTIAEAACLAAFYSKAKNEGKAAVRYTERKFVNKPKGTAPGLVSLASFKTMLVVPGIPDFKN